jgi:hypothetical protein
MEIKLGKPEIVGQGSTAIGLVHVRAQLEPRPDQYWTQIFNQIPPGVTYGFGSEVPTVDRSSVGFRCAPNEIAMRYDEAQRFVDGVNVYYTDTVEPRLHAEKEARERQAAEKRAVLEEAQREIDKLSGN